MIRATADTSAAQKAVERLVQSVTSGSFDAPVEIAAWRTHRALVAATPKKWTGQTRRHWKVEKVGPGIRRVHNDSKVMLFLEGGTGNAGTATSRGGYIYPATKRFLYIPLRPGAMIWRQGLKFGTDYILRKRVRGIKAMKIVENMRPKAAEMLREEMRKFLERIVR